MGAFEDGEGAIQALITTWQSTPEGDRNEATTRLQLIDQLMFNVLGWDRADCEAEARLEGTYTDYEFSLPYRVLIVEAKREGLSFEVPAGTTDHLTRISFFRKYNRAVFAAIEQCARYCQERGVQYGVVTNGHQLIGFLAARNDGVAPLDGDAIVFASLHSMAGSFLLLWNTLSQSGVRQHGLLRELLGAVAHPPEKLSSRLSDYPGFKDRNLLQANLQILAELVLEDMVRLPANEQEFLQTCYSPSGAISQYSLLSKRLLEARYSTLMGQEGGTQLSPAVTSVGVEPDLLAQGLARRPVLLVGDVGAGKTMFIRHFIRIDATEVLSKAIVIYLDLGQKPTFTADLAAFLWTEITRQLREDHSIDIEERGFVRRVHAVDLERFEKGIYGGLKKTDPEEYGRRELDFLQHQLEDREGHIQRSLVHITDHQRKQFVFFVDNVDQRPYDLQQEAFLVANSMAQNWPSTVFVSLRPETFHMSRVRGSLSAYHLKAFTVAPPRLDSVIQRRFEYSLELLQRGAVASLGGVGLDAPSLEHYLTVVKNSFAENPSLAELVDNLCGGNIRSALEYIKTFVASGHVNTRKILDIQAATGSYLVPLHEFIRALLFGDHVYYDPDSSPITNVLDISSDDAREHFILPLLLATVESFGRSEKDGFISVDDAYRSLQDAGFAPRQVDWAMARGLSAKLLERPSRTVDEANETPVERAYVRVTSSGTYHFKRLLANFNYLDAIVTDTPIAVAGFREQIRDVYSINDRLRRALAFIDYLDASWELIGRRDLPLVWPQLSAEAKAQIAGIASRTGGGTYTRRPFRPRGLRTLDHMGRRRMPNGGSGK
jgi:hypothetical protein